MSRGTATDPDQLRTVIDAYKAENRPPIEAAFAGMRTLLLCPPDKAEEAER